MMATDYGNPGGSGARGGIITISYSSGLTFNASATRFIDGSTSAGLWFMTNASAADQYIRCDFGATASKVIDEITWRQHTTVNHGEWKIQASNDLSSWVDIGSTFILGGSSACVISAIATNTAGYRSYQFYGLSGKTTTSPYLFEIDFKIDDFSTVSTSAVVSGLFFCHG